MQVTGWWEADPPFYIFQYNNVAVWYIKWLVFLECVLEEEARAKTLCA